MTVIPSVSPVAPSQPSVISMPWKNSSGVSSASSLATGTGQRAAYGQRLQNANVPKPTGNPRAGEGRLQGGCQDNAARRVCHAGWQLKQQTLGGLPTAAMQSRHAVP